MLPTKYEEKAFDEYVRPYTVAVRPQFEVVISGVVTKRENALQCSMGVYEGLFEDKGIEQHLKLMQQQTFPIEDDRHHLFADHVIDTLHKYHALDKSTDTIRLAVDKYMDENMKPRYKKCIDIHINLICSDDDKTLLHNIIYFLLRYSAVGKYIIQSKRRHNDASEIWTLFPEQTRSGALPAPI